MENKDGSGAKPVELEDCSGKVLYRSWTASDFDAALNEAIRAGVDLTGLRPQGDVDQLRSISLKNRKIVGCDFSDLELAACVLNDCDIVKCNFDRAFISDSTLYRCRFFDCSFVDTHFGADVDCVKFYRCDLTRMTADFLHACRRVVVYGCKLEGSAWFSEQAKQIDFRRSSGAEKAYFDLDILHAASGLPEAMYSPLYGLALHKGPVTLFYRYDTEDGRAPLKVGDRVENVQLQTLDRALKNCMDEPDELAAVRFLSEDIERVERDCVVVRHGTVVATLSEILQYVKKLGVSYGCV